MCCYLLNTKLFSSLFILILVYLFMLVLILVLFVHTSTYLQPTTQTFRTSYFPSIILVSMA
jgi:hypothetical protein